MSDTGLDTETGTGIPVGMRTETRADRRASRALVERQVVDPPALSVRHLGRSVLHHELLGGAQARRGADEPVERLLVGSDGYQDHWLTKRLPANRGRPSGRASSGHWT